MPAILDAPGSVVSTSNKRDVVDGTRGVREAPVHGSRALGGVFLHPDDFVAHLPQHTGHSRSVLNKVGICRGYIDFQTRSSRDDRHHPIASSTKITGVSGKVWSG